MAPLKGAVFSGLGAAQGDPPGMLELIRERSGLPWLLPGTLNLRLSTPYMLRPDATILAADISASESSLPWGWSRDYAFDHCVVAGHRCLILRPTQSDHDDTVLEIMAEVHLRNTLGLSDGAEVIVQVDAE